MRKILIGAALLIVWTAAPAAAQYAHAVVFVKDHTVVPGHAFAAAGIQFIPHETVTLTFGGLCGTGSRPTDVVIGTATVGNDGTFRTLANAIPVGTRPNTYGIRTRGASGDFTCTDVFVTGFPQPHPTMRLKPSTIIPNERPVVTGAGFAHGETVTLTLGRACGLGTSGTDIVLDTTTVGSGGTFSLLGHPIPAGTATGTYGLRAIGSTGDRSCANVFVRPMHHPGTHPPLFHLNRTTGVTSAIVASGGLVLLRTRRRKQGAHTRRG
jgi:hypothetical protein